MVKKFNFTYMKEISKFLPEMVNFMQQETFPWTTRIINVWGLK